jgi:hypothetical protein
MLLAGVPCVQRTNALLRCVMIHVPLIYAAPAEHHCQDLLGAAESYEAPSVSAPEPDNAASPKVSFYLSYPIIAIWRRSCYT